MDHAARTTGTRSGNRKRLVAEQQVAQLGGHVDAVHKRR
jgi:hypothetical protein